MKSQVSLLTCLRRNSSSSIAGTSSIADTFQMRSLGCQMRSLGCPVLSWALSVSLILTVASCGPKDGDYVIDFYSTNDVHGCYFDSLYVLKDVKPSLFAVNRYVDSVRTAEGAEKVVLIDAGDILQGDNAAYYYNFVDTASVHVYAKMANYMKYDALVVGNHDIETGHPVYDRVRASLDMPWLAANAVKVSGAGVSSASQHHSSDGIAKSSVAGAVDSYFDDYCILRRQGLKIAVIGETNANIKAWLDESLWSGMDFRSLTDCVQAKVDEVVAKEHPHIVAVAVHSGTGEGDGSQLESQGMDLYKSLKNVDILFCAHDHRPFVTSDGKFALVNSGSHCRNIGHAQVSLSLKNGEVVDKSVAADLVPVDKDKVDTVMRSKFRQEYEAVKAFSNNAVGELKTELRTRDAYAGMSDYMNLIHFLGLSQKGVDISFAAPLTFNSCIKPGTVVYNDLFTIYPYENQLVVLKMKGSEIKNYLEESYDGWVNTVPAPILALASLNPMEQSPRVLKIVDSPDPRIGQKRWSFVGRSYNFDSAAGLVYTVDVTEDKGSRIVIESLADGTEFAEDEWYNVAMTSYRAAGGGQLIQKGAGISPDMFESRIVAKCPEYRELLYGYLKAYGAIDPAVVGESSIVGGWKFVPEEYVTPLLDEDMRLLFGN